MISKFINKSVQKISIFPSKASFEIGLLSIASLLLVGCASNYILDPVARDLVSPAPAVPWDPDCNPWYCERAESESPVEEVLPAESACLDIAGLLDIALQNHPLTRRIWADARAQAYAVGAAESAYYPTLLGKESLVFEEFTPGTGGLINSNNINSTPGLVGFQGCTGATGPTAVSLPSHAESFVNEITINYLLLDFGGRDANVQATRYALESLNWTQNRVIQQIIIQVINSYYNYVNSKEMIQARSDDLKNAEINLASAEALHEAGVARLLDLLQAKANVENSRVALITAQNQIKIDLGLLATALGIPPSTEFEAKDLPEHFPLEIVTDDMENLMDSARLNRPDLAAAYATLLQTKKIYRAVVSSALPTLTATGYLQQTNYFNHTGMDGHYMRGAIELNIPLFNGFLYVNQIRQAKENIRSASANFDQLENLALMDVVTAYYNFVSAKETMQYSEEYLKFAQESYDLAIGIYRNGTGSMLDVLEGQATLSNAKSQLINARTRWAISIFNIAYATGTLDVPFVSERIEPCCNGPRH